MTLLVTNDPSCDSDVSQMLEQVCQKNLSLCSTHVGTRNYVETCVGTTLLASMIMLYMLLFRSVSLVPSLSYTAELLELCPSPL